MPILTAVHADIAISERFALGACVARGAFGEVLRAEERRTGQAVAIKRVHAHLMTEEVRGRVAREAERISSVSSPYVVRCEGWGQDEAGRACLVLEWLDGLDLGRRGPGISIAEGVHVARKIAEGLEAIHAAGLVHGDIKPSNVMISGAADPRSSPGGAAQNPSVKIIDFGVARGAGEADRSLRGLLVGTPSYMSPEQARGEDAISPASDLFSLGVLLYEIVAGRRPFTGSDPFVVLAKILLEDPPRIAHLAPQVPAAIDAIIARALAKIPEHRFRSAREMADALALVHAPDTVLAAAVDETPTVQITPEKLRPSVPPPAVSGMSSHAEQRVITAVFANLAQAGRARGPRRPASEDDAAALVERAMEAFETAVANQNGVAHRTIGGRMIAVFGAVRSSGDEAQRAARAALTALADVPSAQMAITTGRAVASLAGLSGAAIERGASEVERTSPGALRVDEATARLLDEGFVIEGNEGDRSVVAEAGLVASAPRVLGRDTPMVGREAELARLVSAYQTSVGTSQSRAALILGPPGLGKSRLRFELMRKLGYGAAPTGRGASKARGTLLFGRAESFSAGGAFLHLRNALRRAAGISAGDLGPVQRKKLRQFLGAWLAGKTLQRAATYLGEVAGVPPSDDAAEGLRAARGDSLLMGDQMRSAWEDWLLAATDAGPVLIVLEDLHWGDLPTMRFVEFGLRLCRNRPLFVLGVGRPEVREELGETWGGRPLDVITLGPLARDACEALARAALGRDASRDVVHDVAIRSEGQPFYLEELARAVGAWGAGPRSAAGPSAPTGAMSLDGALPETVLGMVQARLDALGSEAKAVLRAASILGVSFRAEAVRALRGEGQAARVGPALNALVDEEVLVLRRGAAGEEHVFRNALIHDAAYAMLTEEDRVAGHRIAAAYLAETGGADPVALAEHCARGHDTEGAAGWYARAAELALEGNDFRAALLHAGRAASLSRASDLLANVRVIEAEAHRWRGEWEQASQAAKLAADLSVEGGALWFRAMAEIVTAAGRQGREGEVATQTERGLAREVSEVTEEAESAKVLFLARAAVHLGYTQRDDLAERLFAEVNDRAKGRHATGDLRTVARVHQIRALAALRRGDPAQYVREHQQALSAFERAGDERSACLERVSVGSGLADLGAYAESADVLEQALSSAERMGLLHIASWAQQNLGNVRLSLGRKAEARVALEHALAAGEAQKDARLAGGSRIYLSRLAHEEGQFEQALSEAVSAEQALSSVPPMRAGAAAARSRALVGLGRNEEALAAAAFAMQILEGLGPGKMGEAEADVRAAVIEALLAAGDRESAAIRANEARERLLSRAALIGDPDRRRSFLEAVPAHKRTLNWAETAARASG